MSSKKAEARERIKAMREQQARRDRQRERTVRYGVAVAIVAAVAIIAVAVVSSRGGDDGTLVVPTAVAQGNGQDVPTSSGGILVGDKSAPVTIDYWMDFLCPHCKEFEDVNAATIDQLIESGQANVVYHPLTFTGGTYSTRANNAFACAANIGKGTEFVNAAFAAQQQWATGSLVDLGEQAGIGGSYASCVRDSPYNAWSSNVKASARDFNISGTPTVFINGKELPSSAWSPDGIRNQVKAAAQQGNATSPKASSSPSASASPKASSAARPNPSPKASE
jgi:protein-disulfide isomerase